MNKKRSFMDCSIHFKDISQDTLTLFQINSQEIESVYCGLKRSFRS